MLGAGVTLRAGSSFKLALGYDAELRANAMSHTIQARRKMVSHPPRPVARGKG